MNIMKLSCVFVRIVAGAIRSEGANLNMFGDTTFANNTALDGDGGETEPHLLLATRGVMSGCGQETPIENRLGYRERCC